MIRGVGSLMTQRNEYSFPLQKGNFLVFLRRKRIDLNPHLKKDNFMVFLRQERINVNPVIRKVTLWYS